MVDTICRAVKKIPACGILLPLLMGALIKTLAPGLLELGAFTTALFSNSAAATLIGLQLFCLGAQLEPKALGGTLRHGGLLLLVKLLAGFLMAGIFLLLAPVNTVGGVCVLSAVAAVSNSNGSLYLSLSTLHGRKTDMACTPVLALSNGPFFTLLILGLSGFSAFPGKLLIATVLPMLLGMAAAGVYKPVAQKLQPMIALLLPFIGFALGAGMDLSCLWQGGVSGLLLALAVIILACIEALFLKGTTKNNDGVCALMAGATGANAVAIPAAVAMIDPAWQAYASAAAAQLVSCALISALCIPIITQVWQKRVCKQ